MRGAALSLLALLFLPGCIAPPPEPGEPAPPVEEWRFSGSFTWDYRPADLRAVCRVATGGELCAFGESKPPYYNFPYPSRDACEDAKERVAALPRIHLYSGCTRVA